MLCHCPGWDKSAVSGDAVWLLALNQYSYVLWVFLKGGRSETVIDCVSVWNTGWVLITYDGVRNEVLQR